MQIECHFLSQRRFHGVFSDFDDGITPTERSITAAGRGGPSLPVDAAILPRSAGGAARGRSSRPAPRSSSGPPARDALPSPNAATSTVHRGRHPWVPPCTL